MWKGIPSYQKLNHPAKNQRFQIEVYDERFFGDVAGFKRYVVQLQASRNLCSSDAGFKEFVLFSCRLQGMCSSDAGFKEFVVQLQASRDV